MASATPKSNPLGEPIEMQSEALFDALASHSALPVMSPAAYLYSEVFDLKPTSGLHPGSWSKPGSFVQLFGVTNG